MNEQQRFSGCGPKLLRGAGILVLALVILLAGLNINQRIAPTRIGV